MGGVGGHLDSKGLKHWRAAFLTDLSPMVKTRGSDEVSRTP